jgi:hypothetical protein
LCDNRYQKDANEALELDEEVHFQKYEEPKHHDNARGLLIHDIPDHDREDHCESGANDSADEAEDRLSGSHGHANGLHQVRCHVQILRWQPLARLQTKEQYA